MTLPKTQTRASAVRADFEVQDAEKALAELAHIMLNLRHHTRNFDLHFGYSHRIRKKFWQDRADKWLSEHTVKVELLENKTENDE